ncbi:MAG: hypothetical protein Kow0047_32470 [Anaerolineae bacterium]
MADRGAIHFTAALLQATLTAHRITAIVAPAWDGPQLWVFTCSLAMGMDPRKVERLADALALAAGAASCRVSRQDGHLLIEIPKPESERRPLYARRLEEIKPPTKTAVAMGITTGGKVAWLDLADERTCHVIIGGTTGSGKTTALRWLLYRLIRQNEPRDLRLLLLDPKRGELELFDRVPHLLHPVTSHPVQIARVLAWVEGELNQRAATQHRWPRLVIVVEEVADVLSVNPNLEQVLARVAQIGRGLNVHLVATTQQPGTESLGKTIINFPARLVGRVASATLTYGATGRSRTMADQLLGRGDFLLITASEVTRLQVPVMDGRQWGQLPRTDRVATLDEHLPSLAMVSDLFRDTRGRPGRPLSEEDYEAIESALEGGADVDELRARFGIGYSRARRLRQLWEEINEGEEGV